MQKAMFVCIDIYKPNFTVKPQQMSMRRLPMTWFCEMANLVIGEGGKLLEYRQLIANPKT